MNTKILRIFVAMPGSTMGENADWNIPDRIKANFYEEIGKAVGNRLSRKVELIIEKDKVRPGPIHASRFDKALEADVYIADLSGNNANVYLELGVRWALTDGVTILVSQNVNEVLFNASSSRTPYGKAPDLLKESIKEAVEAIIEGLEQLDNNPNYCDSPVRKNTDLSTFSRSDIEKLKDEVNTLKTQRGDDLLSAAKETSNSTERLKLLNDVVSINPNREDAFFELGVELQKKSNYPDSINALKKAIALNRDHSEAYRELDVSYGKDKQDELSVKVLKESIRIKPDAAEALRNYGGALRRWAFRDYPKGLDWNSLQEAQNAYEESGKIERYSTYAKMNVAKLELLLSKQSPSRTVIAEKYFRDLVPLCEYEVIQNPTDYWSSFDFSDALLFSGRYQDALNQYKSSIELIEDEHKNSVIKSVISTLLEIQELDVLQAAAGRNALEDVLNLLKA